MRESQNKNMLNKLDARWREALKRYAELYPNATVFPDSPTIGAQFDKSNSDIENIQSDLFKFKNNMETNIISLANSFTRVDEKITNLKKQNKKLKQKLSSLTGQKEGAQGMFVDSQFLYRQFYIGNWILFLSIVGLGIVYQKNKQAPGIY
tara:strand:+ start:276 stop:725 length:450 start_codon:yes stop_codon:yes gene_type:complete